METAAAEAEAEAGAPPAGGGNPFTMSGMASSISVLVTAAVGSTLSAASGAAPPGGGGGGPPPPGMTVAAAVACARHASLALSRLLLSLHERPSVCRSAMRAGGGAALVAVCRTYGDSGAAAGSAGVLVSASAGLFSLSLDGGGGGDGGGDGDGDGGGEEEGAEGGGEGGGVSCRTELVALGVVPVLVAMCNSAAGGGGGGQPIEAKEQCAVHSTRALAEICTHAPGPAAASALEAVLQHGVVAVLAQLCRAAVPELRAADAAGDGEASAAEQAERAERAGKGGGEPEPAERLSRNPFKRNPFKKAITVPTFRDEHKDSGPPSPSPHLPQFDVSEPGVGAVAAAAAALGLARLARRPTGGARMALLLESAERPLASLCLAHAHPHAGRRAVTRRPGAAGVAALRNVTAALAAMARHRGSRGQMCAARGGCVLPLVNLCASAFGGPGDPPPSASSSSSSSSSSPPSSSSSSAPAAASEGVAGLEEATAAAAAAAGGVAHEKEGAKEGANEGAEKGAAWPGDAEVGMGTREWPAERDCGVLANCADALGFLATTARGRRQLIEAGGVEPLVRMCGCGAAGGVRWGAQTLAHDASCADGAGSGDEEDERGGGCYRDGRTGAGGGGGGCGGCGGGSGGSDAEAAAGGAYALACAVAAAAAARALGRLACDEEARQLVMLRGGGAALLALCERVLPAPSPARAGDGEPGRVAAGAEAAVLAAGGGTETCGSNGNGNSGLSPDRRRRRRRLRRELQVASAALWRLPNGTLTAL
jgi:hypothetical protein